MTERLLLFWRSYLLAVASPPPPRYLCICTSIGERRIYRSGCDVCLSVRDRPPRLVTKFLVFFLISSSAMTSHCKDHSKLPIRVDHKKDVSVGFAVILNDVDDPALPHLSLFILTQLSRPTRYTQSTIDL